MSKSSNFKNAKEIEQILETMHQNIVAGLVAAQLSGENKVKNVVDDIRGEFKQFKSEDILDSFIVFALNVAVDSMHIDAAVKNSSDGSMPIANPGQA